MFKVAPHLIKVMIKSLGAIVWYEPKGRTHLWKPTYKKRAHASLYTHV